jgi:hypothetical protein
MDGTNGMHGTGGSTASALGGAVDGGTVNRVVDVVEKGSKGFVVQTVCFLSLVPFDSRLTW